MRLRSLACSDPDSNSGVSTIMNTPEDIAAADEAIRVMREAKDLAIAAIDVVFSDTSLGAECTLFRLQEIDDALSDMIVKTIDQIEDEDEEEW